MPSPRFAAWLLLAFLVVWALPAAAEEAPAPGAAVQPTGGLESVDLSIGGRNVKVKAGGVVTIHPDAPFRAKGAETDNWLDFGLKYRLEGLSDVDPTTFHTLSELLGDEVYHKNHIDLYVLKGGDILGSVRLLVRPLPIDWLRRAQQAKRPEEQIEYLEKARELTPDDPLLTRRLTDLLVEAGRYRQAVEILEEMAARDQDPERLRRLADLYQRLGQWEKAAAALSKLWAEDPRDSELGWRLAGLYQNLGRWDEAAAVLKRLTEIEKGPRLAEAWAQLGTAMGMAGKPVEAREALEEAVRRAPANADLWRLLADTRRKAGQQDAALEALARAAALAPADRGLRLELAEQYLAAGRKKEAAREMAALAFSGPPDPPLLTRLAGIYQELDDRQGLAKVYAALAKVNPDDPDLNYNLGVLYAESGDPKRALSYFQAAAKARPEDRDIAERIFETMCELGRWDQALEMADRLQKKTPADTQLMELFFARLGQHRPADMARLLERYIKAAKPTESRPYRMLAGLALARDDNDAALKALEMGAKAQPGDLELLAELATFYEARGQDQKALDMYSRILDQNPDYPEAMERYLQIKTRLMEQKTHGDQPQPDAPKPAVPAPSKPAKPKPAKQ